MKKFLTVLLVLLTLAVVVPTFVSNSLAYSESVMCPQCGGLRLCKKCHGVGYNNVTKWTYRRDKDGKMKRIRVVTRERCTACNYGKCKRCNGVGKILK